MVVRTTSILLLILPARKIESLSEQSGPRRTGLVAKMRSKVVNLWYLRYFQCQPDAGEFLIVSLALSFNLDVSRKKCSTRSSHLSRFFLSRFVFFCGLDMLFVSSSKQAKNYGHLSVSGLILIDPHFIFSSYWLLVFCLHKHSPGNNYFRFRLS